jgi:hypothetical protein
MKSMVRIGAMTAALIAGAAFASVQAATKSEMSTKEGRTPAATHAGSKIGPHYGYQGRSSAKKGYRLQKGAEGRSSFGPSSVQGSQIREDIIGNKSARVGRVSFALNVGTVVPRNMHFATLPPRVVKLMPRYRGFKYIVVKDKIVVVDPRTYRIVAVIRA